MEEGVLKETDFRLDHFPVDYDKERIARTLAPLNHLQNLKSSIPDSVTFMEMYGAETFEDLQVSSRWEKNAPYKSLAVPIGLRLVQGSQKPSNPISYPSLSTSILMM